MNRFPYFRQPARFLRRTLAAGLLLCALLLASCGGEDGGEWTLYFQERDLREAAGGGALGTEPVRLPENLDSRGQAEFLLTALLAGPRLENLKSPFPAGTTLLSVDVEGSQAVVDLSSSYGTLSGVALTLADQAIALTLTQLPDILSVQITVRGQELDYRDKQILTARDVLLAPEGDVVGTVEAVLCFPDESGVLTEEFRTLELYEGDTQAGAVARALENGPAGNGLSSAFPEGFRPRSVWMETDVCYVNLSSALLELLPEDADLKTALESLRLSLGSLENVSQVWFLVDGEFAGRYGSVSLDIPADQNQAETG